MNETTQIIFLIAQTIVIPALTAAFTFGIMSGKIQGLYDQIKKNCESITRAHSRIDDHTNKHCLDCPGANALHHKKS